MPYEFEFNARFKDQLKTLANERQEAVRKKIEQIIEMPSHFEFVHRSDKVQKARVGKYRIFFRVTGNLIEILDVRKRDVAYKN